jgi:hypothetical protein
MTTERDTARADITSAPRRPVLTLSAAERQPIGAAGRLTETPGRYVQLNPRRRGRYPAELIARLIADDGGHVWRAVVTFGISYRHALRIRAGWRGGQA